MCGLFYGRPVCTVCSSMIKAHLSCFTRRCDDLRGTVWLWVSNSLRSVFQEGRTPPDSQQHVRKTLKITHPWFLLLISRTHVNTNKLENSPASPFSYTHTVQMLKSNMHIDTTTDRLSFCSAVWLAVLLPKMSPHRLSETSHHHRNASARLDFCVSWHIPAQILLPFTKSFTKTNYSWVLNPPQ